MNKRIIVIVFVFLIVFAFAKAYPAQCAMCRAVLESEADNSTARGINNGIKYLMIMPYILVGGVFYFIWKSRKNSHSED